MKNIQIIDGADNCTFSLFEVTEEEFAALFPAPGQDLEFIEDVIERLGDDRAGAILAPVWERPVHKSKAAGIHGTLFYEFADRREHFPVSKRERDWDPGIINAAQRRLYRSDP